MSRSVASSHSRTRTNSSSHHTPKPSSARPPSIRSRGSAAGSSSTVDSGPFVHADEIDTTIQWIPSYYIEHLEQFDSSIGSQRRRVNSLVPPTPTSSVFSSKISLLPDGLLRLIRASELEQSTKRLLLASVRMIMHVSQQLFPSSHIMREDVAREVANIIQDLCEFLDLVLDKVQQQLDAASSAKTMLPGQVEDEVPLEEAMKWVGIIEGLHKPTQVETNIFRRMATLYEEFVYMPFLQLHRQEPEHNMHTLLDDFLGAVFLRLRAITIDTANADRMVLEVEKTLDTAMAQMTSAPRRHVPSRSMPVANMPKWSVLRQRENTL